MSTSGGGGGGGPSSITSSPSTSGRSNVSVTSINCTDVTTSSNTMLPLNTIMTSPPSSISSSSSGATVINAPAPSTEAVSLITHSNNGNNNNSSSSSNSNNLSNNADQPSALNNGNHFYGNGSIRISVPKMEESDESETELSNIENTATAVSLRSDSTNKNAPRPMSWEGELSENEDRMESECSSNLEPVTNNDQQMKVIAYASNNTVVSNAMDSSQSTQLISKDAIKPEYVEYGTGSDNNTSSIYASSNEKRFPLDMSNVKFEPGIPAHTQIQQQLLQHQQQEVVNSPLLARSKTNLLPANPSPDSAIHSVYTHSSPSQSPLTSRHTPYTPSLSRNNSDASYSSCYSYSSEFSPTHSPIQGRHNMYSGNFNGSPLHHSVLYKPMIEGESVKLQQQHSQEDNVIETEAIPSAGISRQQLINR